MKKRTMMRRVGRKIMVMKARAMRGVGRRLEALAVRFAAMGGWRRVCLRTAQVLDKLGSLGTLVAVGAAHLGGWNFGTDKVVATMAVGAVWALGNLVAAKLLRNVARK